MRKRAETEPAVKAAKSHARRLFSKYGRVAGVGVVRSSGPVRIKVNFESLAVGREVLPTHVDGFAVVFELVGRVRRLNREPEPS